MPPDATQRLVLHDLAATRRLAQTLAKVARPGDAILLEGELGAGKTELARAFLRAATGDDALEVPSPTFTLVQTYDTPIGTVHHFDLWRVSGPAALEELGWDDARHEIVLVEWPDRLGDLRPAGALTLHLTLLDGDTRQADIAGWEDRLPRVAAETPREAEIARFLAAHGYSLAGAEPVAQDASFRRYLRIAGGRRPALLMDAPPLEEVRSFLRIAAHLSALGISAPDILAADPDAGLVLEEDLGDALFAAILSDANQDALFDAAVDALLAIQCAAPPAGLPAWGPVQMRDTALGTLFDWWWPAAFGTDPPDAARQDVAAALNAVLAPLGGGLQGFVHRDWFAGNLIWLPDRTGIRRVGVIDFQGAAIGHPAYDLVSLLQDARRDIAPALADRALGRYLAARPELDPAAFRTAFDACAAQRHLRVACQWVRLAVRDGRPNYLAYGPRTWRLLQAALTRPAAAPLAAALDRWIPPAARGNPPGLAA
jgi:N-acetylmuramate 1-kinase